MPVLRGVNWLQASLAVSQLQQGAQQLDLDLVGKAGKLGTVKVRLTWGPLAHTHTLWHA